MNTCSFCGAKITPNQEKTSIALFTKPVCTKAECEKKAQTEFNRETDKLTTPRGLVLALLARRGFEEQSVKGFYILDSATTKIAVNLNKMSNIPGDACPEIGVLQANGDILEEGHGIGRIDDLRREIEGILKSKGAGNEKKETPAPTEVKHEEEHKETKAGKDEKAEERETGSEKPEVMVPGNVIAILYQFGWKISDDNGAAKTIDSHDSIIDLSRIDQRGKAVCVDGYAYQHGQNNVIDAELKSLFGEIAKAQNKKGNETMTNIRASYADAYAKAMETKEMITCPLPPTPLRPPRMAENPLAKIAELELNTDTVLKYLCPDATLEEAVLFLQICKIKNLNPFSPGEVFLIKYDKTQPASIVVGKYAFTKKADAHPDFRGYQAGIIVLTTEGKIEEREGTFYLPRGRNAKEGDVFETLLGGWARAKRYNREDIIIKVALQECIKYKKDGQPNRSWAEQPATMICKNALVRALRDAFPAELGGLYDESEIQEVG